MHSHFRLLRTLVTFFVLHLCKHTFSISRSYFRRRIQDGFKDSKSLTESAEINQQMKAANDAFQLIKRQVSSKY